MTDNLPQKNNSQILIYQTESGDTKIEVRLENETVWLTQKLMADLFQTTVPNINLHLKNIYEERELDEFSTIKDFLIVQNEGGRQVQRKQDVTIAKNYLDEDELRALNNLVEQYLVFAEGQAMRRIPMHMKDWIEKLNGFLQLNDRNILEHAGKISHEMAKEQAESEYDKFNRERVAYHDRLNSDFNKTLKKIDAEKKHTKVKNHD